MDFDGKRYYVVQFLELPYENINSHVCVPHSWIRLRRTTDRKVKVAYPSEESPETRDRVCRREPYAKNWNVYLAVIKYESDEFVDTEMWILTMAEDEEPIVKTQYLVVKDKGERLTPRERKPQSINQNTTSNPKTNKPRLTIEAYHQQSTVQPSFKQFPQDPRIKTSQLKSIFFVEESNNLTKSNEKQSIKQILTNHEHREQFIQEGNSNDQKAGSSTITKSILSATTPSLCLENKLCQTDLNFHTQQSLPDYENFPKSLKKIDSQSKPTVRLIYSKQEDPRIKKTYERYTGTNSISGTCKDTVKSNVMYLKTCNFTPEAKVQSISHGKPVDSTTFDNKRKSIHEISAMQSKLQSGLMELQNDSNAVHLAITHELSQTIEETYKTFREMKKPLTEGSDIKELIKELKDLREYSRPVVHSPVSYVAAAIDDLQTDMRAEHAEIAKVEPEALLLSILKPHPHKIIIASKDPQELAKNVSSKNQTSRKNKQANKIEICRKARDRKLVTGRNQRETDIEMPAPFRFMNKSTRIGKKLNPYVEIRNVLKLISDEDILKSLRRENRHVIAGLEDELQNSRIKFRRRVRNHPLKCHIVMEVAPKLWRSLVDSGTLYIGLQKVSVIDRSPLFGCTRCHAYGHTRRMCFNKNYICSYCGKTLEKSSDRHICSDTPRCCNCLRHGYSELESNHPSYNAECPVRRKWEAKVRSCVDYC